MQGNTQPNNKYIVLLRHCLSPARLDCQARVYLPLESAVQFLRQQLSKGVQVHTSSSLSVSSAGLWQAPFTLSHSWNHWLHTWQSSLSPISMSLGLLTQQQEVLRLRLPLVGSCIDLASELRESPLLIELIVLLVLLSLFTAGVRVGLDITGSYSL